MSGEGLERRTAMRCLALGAMTPLTALGLPLATVGAMRPVLRVPAGVFTLERVLTRELGDGAAIVVTRRWQIAFASHASGMRVSGEQTFADVAAPLKLAAFAALERARSASRVFPLTLDASGQIVTVGEAPEPGTLVRALETGRALIQSLPEHAPERQDAQNFMAQLAALGAGTVSRMPRDLFFPREGSDTIARDIALADGVVGTVSVTTTADADTESGLLLVAERRISTRIGDSERVASERWSLTRG